MQRAADKNQTLFVPEFLNFRCSQEAMSFEQNKKTAFTLSQSRLLLLTPGQRPKNGSLLFWHCHLILWHTNCAT